MNKTRIAWDTTTIIDAIQQDKVWWPQIEPIYRDAYAGKLEIVVSEISVAEACKISGVATPGLTRQAATKAIERFFDNVFVDRRPVMRPESSLAAEFIRNHNLDTCDAIIAATAALHGATILYTRDGKKKRRKNKDSLLKHDGKLPCPDGKPLRIMAPGGDGGLFSVTTTDAK